MMISVALSALLSFSASQEPRPLGLGCAADSVLEKRVCHSIREAIAASSVVKFTYTGLRTELEVVAVEHLDQPSVSVAVATVGYFGDEGTLPTLLDLQCLVYGANSIPEIGPALVDRTVEQLDSLAKGLLEMMQRER